MDAAPQHRGGGRRGPHVGQGPAPRAPVPQEARPLSSGPAHGLGPERPALHAQETMPEAKAGWLVTRQGDTPIPEAPAVGSRAAVWLEEPAFEGLRGPPIPAHPFWFGESLVSLQLFPGVLDNLKSK